MISPPPPPLPLALCVHPPLVSCLPELGIQTEVWKMWQGTLIPVLLAYWRAFAFATFARHFAPFRWNPGGMRSDPNVLEQFTPFRLPPAIPPHSASAQIVPPGALLDPYKDSAELLAFGAGGRLAHGLIVA